MFLSQKKYAIEILERVNMVTCNPSRTPIDTESKLGADGDSVSDPTLHRSLAGFLDYLTSTRPNISYASFSSSTTDLVAYFDADWAGCPTTRRSTSGYCVFLGNNLLSWSSKHQPTLSRSSAEAEYRGVANAFIETCWLRNLLRELHTPLFSATLVYCDNVSVVYLSFNPVQPQRTKHIKIDIHFVRDLVAAGQVRVLHVPSRYQFSDIFTKGLPSALFEEFRSSLSVRCPSAPTAGECYPVTDQAQDTTLATTVKLRRGRKQRKISTLCQSGDDDALRVVSPSLIGMYEIGIRLGKAKYETGSCSQELKVCLQTRKVNVTIPKDWKGTVTNKRIYRVKVDNKRVRSDAIETSLECRPNAFRRRKSLADPMETMIISSSKRLSKAKEAQRPTPQFVKDLRDDPNGIEDKSAATDCNSNLKSLLMFRYCSTDLPLLFSYTCRVIAKHVIWTVNNYWSIYLLYNMSGAKVVSKKSCILTWKTLCGSFKRQEEEKRFEGNKGYQKQATSNAYLHQNAAAIQIASECKYLKSQFAHCCLANTLNGHAEASIGTILAGGAVVAATAYGAHQSSHGHGSYRHGGYGHFAGHHGMFKPRNFCKRWNTTRHFGVHHENFSLLNTPADEWLKIVGLNLEGVAAEWFQWMTMNGLITTWARFEESVRNCFGPSEYEDSNGCY
ncbi:ribonuclease H-like domain-containing protein [Tanacetum coccineum]